MPFPGAMVMCLQTCPWYPYIISTHFQDQYMNNPSTYISTNQIKYFNSVFCIWLHNFTFLVKIILNIRWYMKRNVICLYFRFIQNYITRDNWRNVVIFRCRLWYYFKNNRQMKLLAIFIKVTADTLLTLNHCPGEIK